jgi:hypothetical protein
VVNFSSLKSKDGIEASDLRAKVQRATADLSAEQPFSNLNGFLIERNTIQSIKIPMYFLLLRAMAKSTHTHAQNLEVDHEMRVSEGVGFIFYMLAFPK